MDLQRLLNTSNGRIILSILLGLGLSTLFRKFCTDRNCMAFYCAPENQILGKTFQQDEKCFQYQPKSTACNSQVKMIVEPAPRKN